MGIVLTYILSKANLTVNLINIIIQKTFFED
jgi:hypothetical protein